MTLRPTDMLEIQSAIDEYERKFPRRPAPSAEVALAWRLGKRVAARMFARAEDGPSQSSEPMAPWVRGVLVAGGCSVGAVVAISLFFVGALVGGFK